MTGLTIGVDARTYFFRAGLGRYCRAVLGALIDALPRARVVVWLSNRKRPDDLPIRCAPGRLDVRVSAAEPGDVAAEAAILPREVNDSNVDVFFSPYSLPPAGIRAPIVLTIHDLTPVLHPELHQAATVNYWRQALPGAATSLTRVAVDSAATRRDLLALYPELERRCSVIPLAADPVFAQRAASLGDASVSADRQLSPGQYILFVGSLEPRKNLLAALDAYIGSETARHLPLVLAGAPRWGAEEIAARLHGVALPPPGGIVPLGFVPDADLPALYQNACMFLYPSLFEGFGLPVLEAMAGGTPVITSSGSAMSEVTGDAALLVNPTDPAAIRRALDAMWADGPLRRTLAECGRQRAREYSWIRTGQAMSRLVTEAAAVPRATRGAVA
jgi:glycosyltransferase involved in cell wall biosynthesis